MHLVLQFLLGIFVLLVSHLLYQHFTQSTLPLPPRAPTDIKIPQFFAYRLHDKICELCGPVFTLPGSFAAGPTIIVGRVDAAIELLEKNGAATSDRPRNISGGEILSGGMRTLITPQGERLRKMRKALHVHLQPQRSEQYITTLQAHYAKRHTLSLIRDPDNHQSHAKLYAASLVLALTYGTFDVRSYEDRRVKAVNKCLDCLSKNLTPGTWKIDRYPWLRYLPGYLRPLQEAHQEELSLFRSQFNGVKSKSQTVSPSSESFVDYLLNNQPEHGLSDDEMAYLAGSMFGAGSDTTASAISIGLMCSALYPEYCASLQEEMKAVFGTAPPTLDEMSPETTPFLFAFVHESFRWRPVSASGFAHKATKDIPWEGYVIPKGSAIFGTTWAISRDPEYFPDPEVFNPLRWINTSPTGEKTFNEDLRAKALRPFGWGRRICPGNRMATRSVLLKMALLHWAFDMRQDSKAPIDSLAFTPGMNTHPLPFAVRFSPREGQSWESITTALDGYGELEVQGAA